MDLINLIAIYYQIRDDYMNLQSQEVTTALSIGINLTILVTFQYQSKKGLADDLTEGKFSFPIIHGIRSDPDNGLLLSEFLYCL
jgi:geranylgeranyl diphosphate synthase type 3